jgi:hypothetical protein
MLPEKNGNPSFSILEILILSGCMLHFHQVFQHLPKKPQQIKENFSYGGKMHQKGSRKNG